MTYNYWYLIFKIKVRNNYKIEMRFLEALGRDICCSLGKDSKSICQSGKWVSSSNRKNGLAIFACISADIIAWIRSIECAVHKFGKFPHPFHIFNSLYPQILKKWDSCKAQNMMITSFASEVFCSPDTAWLVTLLNHLCFWIRILGKFICIRCASFIS